jgi:hypothetical protein
VLRRAVAGTSSLWIYGTKTTGLVGNQQCLGDSPRGTQDLSVFINDTLHFIGAVYTTEGKQILAGYVRAQLLTIDLQRI